MSKGQLPTTREWQAMPGSSKGKLNGWFNQFEAATNWIPDGPELLHWRWKVCVKIIHNSVTTLRNKQTLVRRTSLAIDDSLWAFICVHLLCTSGPLVSHWFLIDFSLVSHWFPSAPSPPVLDRALSYISVPDHECHHHKCTARCDRSFEVLEWGWALEFGHARGKLQHCQGCEEVAQFGYLTEPSNRFPNWSTEAGKRVALKKARNTLSNGSTEQCFDWKLLLICGLKNTLQNQSSESFPTWYSWFSKRCRGQELRLQSWTYWNAGKTWTNPKKVCPGMLAL